MSGVAGQLLIGAAGGLVAAIVTAGVSLFAVWLSLRDARARDRLADARHLRDDRRERLRGSIQNIVLASLGVGQVVREKSALMSNEPVQQRDERHVKLLGETWQGLNEARVALMVQSHSKPLVAIADAIMDSFRQYTSRLRMNTEHPGTVPYQEIDEQRQKVEDGIDHLIGESQRILDGMDTPI